MIYIYTVINPDNPDYTIKRSPRPNNCVIREYLNKNQDSLSICYNNIISNHKSETVDDILVLAHSDLSIEDSCISNKLYNALIDGEYDIAGIAGTTECVIKDHNLWHIMNNKKPQERHKVWSGAVGHYLNDGSVMMTSFGPTPRRVILIDGVFIAFNYEKIKKSGLKFSESCPSKFHFYDINFCLDANKLGLKITTLPIWCVHKSHGLSDLNNTDWVKGNKYLKER